MKLKADYEKKTGDRRNIRLPEPNEIVFGGEEDLVTITMKEKAVVANLQTDAAAFEAWSLALKVWCGVGAVELKWDRVARVGVSATNWCHYQRFLYRAERFGTLCGDWFHLSEEALLSDAEALGNGPFFLNVPGDRLPFEEPIESGGDDDQGSESDTEKSLLRPDSFKVYFRLAKEKVDRQLPVGLFRGHVAKENRIFTGGKSAIDLVGVGDANGTLSIFRTQDRRQYTCRDSERVVFLYERHQGCHPCTRHDFNSILGSRVVAQESLPEM